MRQDELPAVEALRTLSKDELIRIVIDDAKNWLAHHGLWFQAVEGRHGIEFTSLSRSHSV
jgi:hypothetical protein